MEIKFYSDLTSIHVVVVDDRSKLFSSFLQHFPSPHLTAFFIPKRDLPRFWSESFFGSPWSLINSTERTNNLSTSLIMWNGGKNHIELSPLDFRLSIHDFHIPSHLCRTTYIRKKEKEKISTREMNWFSNSHSETWNPNSTSVSMWKMCQMKFMSCNLRRIREITKFASAREKSKRERGRQQTATTSFQPKNGKHTDGGGERWYEKLISLLLIPYWTFVLHKPNQTDSHFSLLVVSSLNHSHTVLAACQSSCCCWFNRQENRVNERREKTTKAERRQQAHDRFDRDINFDDTISSLFFFW